MPSRRPLRRAAAEAPARAAHGGEGGPARQQDCWAPEFLAPVLDLAASALASTYDHQPRQTSPPPPPQQLLQQSQAPASWNERNTPADLSAEADITGRLSAARGAAPAGDGRAEPGGGTTSRPHIIRPSLVGTTREPWSHFSEPQSAGRPGECSPPGRAIEARPAPPRPHPPPSLLLPLPVSLLYTHSLPPPAPAPRTAARPHVLCRPADCSCAALTAPPPPPSRTKWTRRVPHPVLIGHAASLTPY